MMLAIVCMCAHVRLTGNLERVIQGVELLSTACVSGTEAGTAIELLRQDNAALETVCEHVKESRGTRRELHIKLPSICFLLWWFSRS